ncbi:MAG: DEAD/DEAH box helicase, partial [Hyphomicrobiales bacterium]
MAARKTTKRRSSPRRASTKPLIPTPGHGEQIWILDVPYRAPAPGAKYYTALKAHAYIGAQLPDELAVYASKPYSYARWVEEDLNGVRQPGAAGFHKTPRPEQVDAAKAIATAFHHGKRGFLLADEPGVGKT